MEVEVVAQEEGQDGSSIRTSLAMKALQPADASVW